MEISNNSGKGSCKRETWNNALEGNKIYYNTRKKNSQWKCKKIECDLIIEWNIVLLLTLSCFSNCSFPTHFPEKTVKVQLNDDCCSVLLVDVDKKLFVLLRSDRKSFVELLWLWLLFWLLLWLLLLFNDWRNEWESKDEWEGNDDDIIKLEWKLTTNNNKLQLHAIR